MLNLEFWFTVAVFILFLEVAVTLLVFVALWAGLAYGSQPLRVKLKEYVPLLQQYSATGARLTDDYTGKAMTPLIKARSGWARLDATWRGLVGRK